MFKKSAFVAATAAGVMMIGAPAFAGGGSGYPGGHHGDDDFSVLDVGDVVSNNSIPVCHNNVNVLGVQVTNIANGLGLSLPILNDNPVSSGSGGGENCVATTHETNID